LVVSHLEIGKLLKDIRHASHRRRSVRDEIFRKLVRRVGHTPNFQERNAGKLASSRRTGAFPGHSERPCGGTDLCRLIKIDDSLITRSDRSELYLKGVATDPVSGFERGKGLGVAFEERQRPAGDPRFEVMLNRSGSDYHISYGEGIEQSPCRPGANHQTYTFPMVDNVLGDQGRLSFP